MQPLCIKHNRHFKQATEWPYTKQHGKTPNACERAFEQRTTCMNKKQKTKTPSNFLL
jgi:hypothetical protein